MKKTILALFSLLAFLPISAQTKWYNPMDEAYPTLQNQGFTLEIGKTYYRLPDRAEGKVTDPLWKLSRNSAGLALEFLTNADQIKFEYEVSEPLDMPHMPSTGVSGVDLYSLDGDNNWKRHWGGYSFGDTVTYTFTSTGDTFGHSTKGRNRLYRVYLPLFNTVKWLKVGVPEGSDFKFVEKSAVKPVVIYGTSIAHGACASRPGMAWANLLNRNIGLPVVDLGFSGNGKLAPEMIDFVNEVDAQLYILDCLPNLVWKSDEEIKALATAAVKQIRAQHSTPILLVEHIGQSNMYTNEAVYNMVNTLNRGLRDAFDSLKAEGVQNLYYLSKEEIGMTPDDYVDYIHPSDLGQQRQAAAVTKKIIPILNAKN